MALYYPLYSIHSLQILSLQLQDERGYEAHEKMAIVVYVIVNSL